MHPLHDVLRAAAAGRFPPADGAVDVLPPDVFHAVVELTGHSYVLTDRSADAVLARGADGFGGAVQPDVVRWLAGPNGWIGSHDVVLVARGTGAGALDVYARDDLEDHPRVRRSRRHRREVEVFGDDAGLITLGRGLVGRLELTAELLAGAAPSAGHGRRLIHAGLGLVNAGELVWAQVAPGNAASLRAFLACGFTPIGAEILIAPAPPTD